MEITFLLEQVVNGLVLGGYYLLLALGLSLIFSVGGIVNLAHGAFYAIGAYASLELIKLGGFGVSILVTPMLVACWISALVSSTSCGVSSSSRIC